VQEEERGRLAREIHDSTGQTLAAIKFNLENAMEGAKALGIAGKTAAAWLEPLVPMVMKAIEEVRTIYMGLRPTVLDDFGIGAGIEWFCREFAKAYPQIEISRMIDVEDENLTPELNTIIYRIIQEALTNAAKHSGATIVNLFLVEDENIIELTVEDNGTGFDLLQVLRSDDPSRGFGLASMRELVEISGGQFAIESTVGKGTYIRATWPCRRLETI
jgi:signal transduction histidine kinase